MNAFQWVLIALCSVQALVALGRCRRTRGWMHLLFALVWLSGAVLAVDPRVTTAAAQALGIERGVDLMFYILCVAFLWAHYQHYLRYRRLEENLTLVVRELSIVQARHPQAPAGAESK